MRPRAVGGYEPDERDQHELSELWHTSRTAIALPGPERQALLDRHGGERGARLHWVVEQFLRAHDGEPHVARKWVYTWSEANLDKIAPGFVEAPPSRSGRRSPGGRSSGRGRRRSSAIPRVDMSWLGPPPPRSAHDPFYLRDPAAREPTAREMELDIVVACSPESSDSSESRRFRKDQRVRVFGDVGTPTLDPIPDGEVVSVFEDYGQPHINVLRGNGQLRAVARSGIRSP